MATSFFSELRAVKNPKLVVVGGGFGGLKLVNELSNTAFDVTLIDRNNFHTFQPLLYQVATASLSADSIGYPFRRTIGTKKNLNFLMADVQQILPDKKVVETSAGQVGFDILVIATGSVTNFFGNAEMSKYAMQLKSISQALDIRSVFLQDFEKAAQWARNRDETSARRALNFVIVGAGPTGVEVAGALAEIKNNILQQEYREIDPRMMRITLMDAGPRVLAAMNEKSGRKAQQYLEKLGVNIRLNTMVTSFDGETLVLKGDEKIETHTVIWAAGVKANPLEGLPESAILKNGRIEVNQFNEVKNCDGIFAIGDVAQMSTEAFENGHPMMAQPAIQQATLLANNLKGAVKNKSPKAFVYNDKGSMATVGRLKAVVEIGNNKLAGGLAWYIWMAVHVMFLIGFRNRIVVLFNWAVKYFSYKNTIRLIIRPFQQRVKK